MKLVVLSESEKEKIHQESLKILELIGVSFKSDRALKLLGASGARVDTGSNMAWFDRDVVESAIKKAPKSFTLGARNSKYNFEMPSTFTGYTLDGTASFAVDFETGERRYGTLKDIELGSRVFDTVELGTVNWPPVIAADAPQTTRVLHEFLTAVKYTSKHVQHELHRPEEVPYFIEALKCILGSTEAVRERKICSVCYCPVAPLTHEGPMSEACMQLIEYDMPVLLLPMPACGSTGPASLFSNISLANAEALSALVLFQLAKPGSPLIFGAASGTMDYRTGAFLEGTPEMVIQTAALGEMARFYGFPNTQAGCLTDSSYPGAEAVMEKTATTLPLVLSGADLVNGMGELETSQLLVLEQIIVDEEIALRCKRLKDGVAVSDNTDLFKDLLKVGPGGHFLAEESTFQSCRSDEFYQPGLFDRSSFQQWVKAENSDIYEQARRKVADILAAPPLNPLPDKVGQSIDDILKRAEAEL